MTNIASDREKRIITNLVEQGRTLVPGTTVRFIERVEQPGQKEAVVIGVQLPDGVSAKVKEVFLLHDLFLKYGREQGLPIGMLLKEPANFKGAIDLSFLSANVIAPPRAISTPSRITVPRPLAIGIAVVVLLVVVAFLLQRQKTGEEVQELAGTLPAPFHGEGAARRPQRNWATAEPQYPTNQIPSNRQFPWLPPAGLPQNGALNQNPNLVNRETNSRQRTLYELNEYRNALRANGQMAEAAQVERLMHDLP